MNVIDASVVVQLLVGDRRANAPLRRELQSNGDRFAAPHLLDAEVGQVLRRFVLAGRMSEDDAREALGELESFPLVRYEHRPLLPRAFDMHAAVTIYDALYVALAEWLGGAVLTLDARLTRANGLCAPVVLLSVPES